MTAVAEAMHSAGIEPDRHALESVVRAHMLRWDGASAFKALQVLLDKGYEPSVSLLTDLAVLCARIGEASLIQVRRAACLALCLWPGCFTARRHSSLRCAAVRRSVAGAAIHALPAPCD